MFTPKNIEPTMNSTKLDFANAIAAITTPTAADNDAMANPLLRPMRCMSIVAGTVVSATETTISDTGNVDQAWLSTSVEPMMPPSVTMAIAPVADKSWQETRTIRLCFCISWPADEKPHSSDC